MLADYCQALAGQAGTNATEVWEWAYLERVSTGLYALSLGADDDARPLLQTAQVLLPA